MNDDLLKEARRIDYRLRSTFFYRKLHELGLVFNLTILLGDEVQRNDFLAYIGKLLET